MQRVEPQQAPESSATRPPPAAERTFFIRPDGSLWHVEDHRGDAGGIFTTLDAALTFARRECGRHASVRLVIRGSQAARAA
jgi:hypothetical protein